MNFYKTGVRYILKLVYIILYCLNKYIIMSEPIAKMIKQGTVAAIQNYLINYIPEDRANLQRIYNQLDNQHLKPKGQKDYLKRSASATNKYRSSSVKILKKIQRSSEEYEQITRTKKLIRNLKDKGFKPIPNQQDAKKVVADLKQKITKPLNANKKILKSDNIQMDGLINRYSLNKDFYIKKSQDINFQNVVDRGMKQFLERRKLVLDSLINRQNRQAQKYQNRYKNVKSKFSEIQKNHYEYQTHRELQEFEIRKSKNEFSSTKNIIQVCKDQILKEQFETVNVDKNYYAQLQNFFNQFQDELLFEKLAYKKSLKKSINKEIDKDRYTNTYLRFIAHSRHGNKCKLNGYAKDLLKNQIKLRRIIDFSKNY